MLFKILDIEAQLNINFMCLLDAFQVELHLEVHSLLVLQHLVQQPKLLVALVCLTFYVQLSSSC